MSLRGNPRAPDLKNIYGILRFSYTNLDLCIGIIGISYSISSLCFQRVPLTHDFLDGIYKKISFVFALIAKTVKIATQFTDCSSRKGSKRNFDFCREF